MSPLRTRLAALTCAAAVALASGPVSGAAQAQVPTPSRVGLDRLLASGAGSARGIATFSWHGESPPRWSTRDSLLRSPMRP